MSKERESGIGAGDSAGDRKDVSGGRGIDEGIFCIGVVGVGIFLQKSKSCVWFLLLKLLQ